MVDMNLIVVVYKIESNLEVLRTIDSLVGIKNSLVLLIISEKNKNIEAYAKNRLNEHVILVDLEPGLYNAMNRGIDYFNKHKYCSLMFINGGDEINADVYNSEILQLTLGNLYSFRTHQKYLSQIYERPGKGRARNIKSAPHQGLIVCTNRSVPYYETSDNLISADVKWQVELSKVLNVKFCDPIISSMYLGGISNRPSFRTLKIRASTDGYRRGIKEFAKFVLYNTLGPKVYYWCLSWKW